MNFHITPAQTDDIRPFRQLFLREINCQFIANAYHERGWADVYLVTLDDRVIGYGALEGKRERKICDTVFEFYVLPTFREYASDIFFRLLKVSGAVQIECQTNDRLLAPMLYAFGTNIRTNVILFEDHHNTALTLTGALFRAYQPGDAVFDHHSEPRGEYVIEWKQEIVATGGFLLHYNPPFADLYMEVKEEHRRKGYGSLIIQELKRACYCAGRVPAARCNVDNHASGATLLKAGMGIVGYELTGRVKR